MNINPLKNMSKKGIASNIGVVAIMLGFGGVLIGLGVTAIVLGAFNDSTTTATANTIFGNGLTMLSNFTGQLGTAGTIAGVLVLVVLVGSVGLMGYNQGKKGGYF